ncbi:MAG: hypothetical protein K8R53_03330 [Bacteroidales bacterium]|nr:hypothetical protein [Bacteroidales bacterium]
MKTLNFIKTLLILVFIAGIGSETFCQHPGLSTGKYYYAAEMNGTLCGYSESSIDTVLSNGNSRENLVSAHLCRRLSLWLYLFSKKDLLGFQQLSIL